MEYLLVRYPQSRTVLIDGADQGRTNRLIELAAGTYTVTLAPPADFAPKRRRVRLRDTSPIVPKAVAFAPRA